jgi:hypothetical protein
VKNKKTPRLASREVCASTVSGGCQPLGADAPMVMIIELRMM